MLISPYLAPRVHDPYPEQSCIDAYAWVEVGVSERRARVMVVVRLRLSSASESATRLSMVGGPWTRPVGWGEFGRCGVGRRPTNGLANSAATGNAPYTAGPTVLVGE